MRALFTGQATLASTLSTGARQCNVALPSSAAAVAGLQHAGARHAAGCGRNVHGKGLPGPPAALELRLLGGVSQLIHLQCIPKQPVFCLVNVAQRRAVDNQMRMATHVQDSGWVCSRLQSVSLVATTASSPCGASPGEHPQQPCLRRQRGAAGTRHVQRKIQFRSRGGS